MKKQISQSLRALGLQTSDFRNFEDLDDEFKFLRRHYLKQCLKTHPDKGGDADVFRNVNESFEFLKDLVEKNLITTLKGSSNNLASDEFDFIFESSDEMPSYQYYEQAAKQDMPPYRVEYAKTGRGKCFAKKASKTCGEEEEDIRIEKGEVRIGSMDQQSGTYGRWCHIHCWRVPSRIWLGIPDTDTESDPQVFIQALLKLDGVSLIGFADLKEEDQLAIVKHVTDKKHWAKRMPKKKKKTMETIPADTAQGDAKPAPFDNTTTALVITEPNQLVHRRERFLIPVPGVGGALPNSLQGQTIVMTGTFPEVGGGVGLNMGKDKVKAMCQSFGARVTGSVSGKTTLLLVGKEPGMSKVSKAKQREIPTTDIHNIRNIVLGQIAMEEAPPASITDFSAGYKLKSGHNGLALQHGKAYLDNLRHESAAVPKKRPAAIEAAPSMSAKPNAKKAKKATKKNVPPPADDKENSNPPTANQHQSSDTTATDTTNDYSKMTCKALRAILKNRGLKAGGKKAVLIERLKEQQQRPEQVSSQPPVVPKNDSLQPKQPQQVRLEPKVQQQQRQRSNPSEQMRYQLALLQNQAMNLAMSRLPAHQGTRQSVPRARHPATSAVRNHHFEQMQYQLAMMQNQAVSGQSVSQQAIPMHPDMSMRRAPPDQRNHFEQMEYQLAMMQNQAIAGQSVSQANVPIHPAMSRSRTPTDRWV